jgi:hypothetical protein
MDESDALSSALAVSLLTNGIAQEIKVNNVHCVFSSRQFEVYFGCVIQVRLRSHVATTCLAVEKSETNIDRDLSNEDRLADAVV